MVMSMRQGRPLLLIDLAVPRDIDAACGELEGVSLYDIDDLQAVIARNRNVRQAEARKAEGIIEEEIQHFAAWLGSLEILPTLAALRVHAAEIADQVIAENAGKWESASPRDLERVEALAQARWVAERIEDETELVTINATGPLEDKSRWVSELERALLEDRIDVAVHSAKDVPTELPDGLELVAIPSREDARDAICGAASLQALPAGARVGTSSLRRTAQLRALRPDLQIAAVRGNVDTRLR